MKFACPEIHHLVLSECLKKVSSGAPASCVSAALSASCAAPATANTIRHTAAQTIWRGRRHQCLADRSAELLTTILRFRTGLSPLLQKCTAAPCASGARDHHAVSHGLVTG